MSYKCAKHRTITLFDPCFLPFTPLFPSNPLYRQLSQVNVFINSRHACCLSGCIAVPHIYSIKLLNISALPASEILDSSL